MFYPPKSEGSGGIILDIIPPIGGIIQDIISSSWGDNTHNGGIIFRPGGNFYDSRDGFA